MAVDLVLFGETKRLMFNSRQLLYSYSYSIEIMHNSKTGIYSPNHHTLYTLHYPVHSSAISAYAPFSLKLTPKSTLPAKPPSPHSLALKLFPTIRKTFFNRSEERKIKKERSRKSTTIFGKLSRNHDCRSTGKRQPIFRINHRVKPMR